ASSEHERGKRQDVGVHHPLQVGELRVEVGLDGRQGDVDNRGVQEHYKQSQSGHQQRNQLAGASCRTQEFLPFMCVQTRAGLQSSPTSGKILLMGKHLLYTIPWIVIIIRPNDPFVKGEQLAKRTILSALSCAALLPGCADLGELRRSL